jgi:Xaa-Pro aminopeptidase
MTTFPISGLLNLRGSDISYNPVFFSYATVSQKDVTLFISESKITPNVHKHFETEGLNVKFAPYESIKKHVEATVGELVSHSI